MKAAIALACLLLLAVSANATDVAKDRSVYREGVSHPGVDIVHADRSRTAVVSLYEGYFEDLSEYYLEGMAAADFRVDYYADPGGNIDYSGYELVLVTTSDNWHGSRFSLETRALAAYMDGGGKVIIVGQDWLWGSGDYGFANAYFGVAGVIEDIAATGDLGPMSWEGTLGGPLSGQSGSMTPCFPTTGNGFFSDAIVPSTQGVLRWESPLAPVAQEGGSIGRSGLLSTVEFACEQLDVVGFLASWWLVTAHEESNIGSIKSRY